MYIHLAVSSSNSQSRVSQIRSGDKKSTVITRNWDVTALKNYMLMF